jgi:hypothetical protein
MYNSVHFIFKILLISLVVLLGVQEANAAASKPHIFFLMTDDYGWANIGYHKYVKQSYEKNNHEEHNDERSWKKEGKKEGKKERKKEREINNAPPIRQIFIAKNSCLFFNI